MPDGHSGAGTEDFLGKKDSDVDQLFIIAEELANDFELSPGSETLAISRHVQGLVSEERIQARLAELQSLDVDGYVEQTILPCEAQNRPGAKHIFKRLPGKVLSEIDEMCD